MNSLENIEQRVANAALQHLQPKLPNLIGNCILSDPGVQTIIRQSSRAAIDSFLPELKRAWESQTAEYHSRQERVLEVERECNRQFVLEVLATRRQAFVTKTKKIFSSLGLLALCLSLLLILAQALPAAIQKVWQPPLVQQLEAANQQLLAQVALLCAQPRLQQSVLLLSDERGVWAEIGPGATPIRTRLFSAGNPERQAWLISLKPFQPKSIHQ